MKVVIAGGRDYKKNSVDYHAVMSALESVGATEIVSGGATGADQFGEDLAKHHGLKVTRFSADWKTYGKLAGPLRNKQMAEYCDYVILLPGGIGTASMKNEAIKAGKKIILEIGNDD